MPISNLSNGLRTGVCTSTNRPTTPYEGQVIYETDTDLTFVWNGTAWLYLSTPQTSAIGGTVAYTPTWTGLTVGNGTNVGSYNIINKVCHVEGRVTFGSTTAITASNPFSPLPIAPVTSGLWTPGSVVYADAGTATYVGTAFIIGSTSWYCFIQNFATAYGSEVAVTATIPFTWTTSDTITWSFDYQIA